MNFKTDSSKQNKNGTVEILMSKIKEWPNYKITGLLPNLHHAYRPDTCTWDPLCI
jgi:hypothetical protein